MDNKCLEISRGPSRLRRGMTTMLVVLGVIILVTVSGLGILAVTNGESLIAGSFLDMRTKENASRSGLRDAIARMRSHPRNTITQLQQFLDDSVTTTPHAWFVPVGDSFRLDVSRPNYLAMGDDGSGYRVRVLGIDPGGAFGSMDGIKLALESNGMGRSGDRQTVVGTYHMRGLEVSAITVAPAEVDSYALYINGSMGNSTIATNIKGDVYVGGNNHLNASVSITVDGNLRTQGNYKTSAAVTVTKNAYVGGYIENTNQGPMVVKGNMGVGGGFGTVTSLIEVDGSLNVYGTSLQNWNSSADLIVKGEQFFMRDRKFSLSGTLDVVNGNGYFPLGLETAAKGYARFGKNLELGGTVVSALPSDSVIIGQDLAVRGALSPDFAGTKTRVGRDAYLIPTLTQTGGQLWIKGNARFDNGITTLHGAPGVKIDGETWLNHTTGQNGFAGDYVQLGTTFAMNGVVGSTFGKSSGSYTRWKFPTTGPSRTWSYQNPSQISFAPAVENSTTKTSGKTDTGGPWRTTAVTFPTLCPWVPAKGMTQLGFSVKDTLVSLIDNPPDTVILNSVQNEIHDFSKIKDSVGVTTALTGSALNKLFDWFAAKNYLHNGYMVLRMDLATSMTGTDQAFHGKCLLIWDANLITNMGWPASAGDDNIQVLFVRNGDLGNNFGSPGPFYGYIHYEKQWSGNHKWPTGSRMYGSIYLAGASSSIIGNGSELELIRDKDVMEDIQQKLGILYPHGAVGLAVGSHNSKKLTLRETWLQFDVISEVR